MRLELVSWIAGALLALMVISCSEMSTDSKSTEKCFVESDSTYICDENQYQVY